MSQKKSSHDRKYAFGIDKRLPILFENMLQRMDEVGASWAGLAVSDYNFCEGHRILSDLEISHVGIRARSHGGNQHGRVLKTIVEQKNPTTMLSKAFWEVPEEEKQKERKHYIDWKNSN